jgi:tRNA (cmo5U34)-methyltransferase
MSGAAWDPEEYAEVVASIPGYERLQEELIAATRDLRPGVILELGTGTGETAARLLEAHPRARLVGVDASPRMLASARAALPPERVELRVGRIEDALPQGPFELVASALAVHHLDRREKASLFRRIASVLAPEGRFVLGDVVVPRDPAEARVELEEGFDLPDPVDVQLELLREAGLDATVAWERGDLAVLVGARPS